MASPSVQKHDDNTLTSEDVVGNEEDDDDEETDEDDVDPEEDTESDEGKKIIAGTKLKKFTIVASTKLTILL